YRPYFLAGGVSGENVEDIIQKWHPYAVDISSSVETDGFKDYQKVKEVIQRVRTAGQSPA
ncbi:MAG: phosphoribosylanthranilate isomerase, partial [Lachnospiraceae bacterium]|nr:phosphoribosylanthranilate isomerase [Lachnospiraceae bacterium]